MEGCGSGCGGVRWRVCVVYRQLERPESRKKKSARGTLTLVHFEITPVMNSMSADGLIRSRINTVATCEDLRWSDRRRGFAHLFLKKV